MKRLWNWYFGKNLAVEQVVPRGMLIGSILAIGAISAFILLAEQ